MTRYFRKVIKIRAEDSPNVRSGTATVPGVLTLEEYQKRRAVWDSVRATIGLDAEFYEGLATLLFPPDWLDRANRLAHEISMSKRQAVAIGIDPGEGVAETVMVAVDRRGVLDLRAKRTSDTAIITAEAIAFGREHGVKPEKWFFDRGGGGKQHADRLRAQGYEVNTVAFGEAPSLPIRHAAYTPGPRREIQEERYAYVNRRAEMFGILRLKLDPSANPEGFAIPARYTELRRQLAPIPLTFDPEGRLYVLPKDKKDPDSKTPTLKELIGCSPDHVDACVLAVWGLDHEGPRRRVGALT